MKQIPLAIGAAGQGPDYRFDNFLPGNNRAAWTHALEYDRLPAPVYFWGPPGSGKTHLLRAYAQRAQERGDRVQWLEPGSLFPWSIDEASDLVIFDACDRLDHEQQHAAFAIFADATARGVSIASAGRVPPIDLPLREDLRTRLAWGHVFALQTPTEPEVRAILRREADRRGMLLSEDLMHFLLTRFERDLGHLMSQLCALDQFSLSTKRNLTVPLLKQMLQEALP